MTGTDESPYSNIWSNATAGDTTPPEWSGSDIGIKAATPGDASVNVEWFIAADSQNDPVTYNIYYAETGTGINWSTPQLTGQSGTSKMINGLTNGVSYDFNTWPMDQFLIDCGGGADSLSMTGSSDDEVFTFRTGENMASIGM